MISRRPRDVRLPSLSQVAGSDILSLDLNSAAARHSKMQYHHSGLMTSPQDRGFNGNAGGGRFGSSGIGFDTHGYSDPFQTNFDGGKGYSPRSSLEPVGPPYPRLRKHSSSTSLREGFGNESVQPLSMSSDFPHTSGTSFGSRGQLPPLPPLSSLSNMPPLPSYDLPPLSRHSRSAGTGPISGFSKPAFRGTQQPTGSDMSMESDAEQNWNHLKSSPRGNSAMPILPGITGSSGYMGMTAVGGLKCRGSITNLKLGNETVSMGLGGLPAPISPLSMSSGLDFGLTTSSGGGLGTLPMPSMQRNSSRSGTGHIVLATDYRLVRLSQNVSAWLGLSATSAVGQPVSSLVAASDQIIFSDFLASLHAERRKAEKTRLHSGLGGGDTSARGMSVTVNLTTGYGGSKPFVLTVRPVTRRMQGYQQAVLTGEVIPAFTDAFSSSYQSVTPF